MSKNKMTEEKLMDLALQIIERYKFKTELIGNFQPKVFYETAWVEINGFLQKISDEKLALIILLSLKTETKTKWRQTHIGQIEPIRKINERFERNKMDGRSIVFFLAYWVVTAAVYDILATKKIMEIARGPEVQTVEMNYHPPLKLRAFVLEKIFKE